MTLLYWLLGVVGYLGIGVIAARVTLWLDDQWDEIAGVIAVFWPAFIFVLPVGVLCYYVGRLILYTRKERR